MPIMHSAHRQSRGKHALAALAAFIVCAPSWNIAHAAVETHTDIGSSWTALSDDRLDDMRGGFDTDAGLKISIGIQRAVYINGNLVTTTSLNIPDAGTLAAGQANALRASAGTVNVIRNGAGSSFDARNFEAGAVSSSAFATVIQNTLNNQDIRNLTVIDATANSLGLLKSMNFQSGLRDALNTAAGSR